MATVFHTSLLAPQAIARLNQLWDAAIDGPTSNPMTAPGDIVVGGEVVDGVPLRARLAKGAEGQVLTIEEGMVSWADPVAPVDAYTPRRVLTINPAIGNIEVDWSQYDEVRANLAGDVTFSFWGAVDGQLCTMKLTQDANGARSVDLGSSVCYSADVLFFAPSFAPNKSDRIGFIYDAADETYDLVSLIKGF